MKQQIQQNQTKKLQTLRLCSTSGQEEGSGEITTENLRQSGKTHVVPSEAESFGEIPWEIPTPEREGSVQQAK